MKDVQNTIEVTCFGRFLPRAAKGFAKDYVTVSFKKISPSGDEFPNPACILFLK
jgi:hypothetical protein